MKNLVLLSSLLISFNSFATQYFAKIDNNINQQLRVQINYNSQGFDSSGIHRDTGTQYDNNGFDQNGIHRDTGTNLDPNGMDITGTYQPVFFPFNGVINGTSINMAGNDYYIQTRSEFRSTNHRQTVVLVFDSQSYSIGYGQDYYSSNNFDVPFITEFIREGYLYTWDTSQVENYYSANVNGTSIVRRQYAFTRTYVGE